MAPRPGQRSSLIDDEALLGSTGSRDMDYQHFDIDGSAVSQSGGGVVGTMKGWWADDRKRKLIIGAIVAGVVLFIIIVAIAASAGREHKGEGGGGGGGRSSSSTGGGGLPVASSSSGGGISISSSSSSSTGGSVPSISSSSGGGGGGGGGGSSGGSSGSSGGGDSSSSSSAVPPPNPDYPWLSSRLPTYIVPRHYDLFEAINIDQRVFGGTVDIALDITQYTSHLVLHSVGLFHSSVAFTDSTGNAVPLTSWYYAANSYLVLNFTSQVVPPQTGAKLSIAFGGVLSLTPRTGMFLSTYRAYDTAPLQWMISTQFESFGARRAFPCFDEPGLKASFSITITSAPQYPTVLSNMPIISKAVLPSGEIQTTFNKTVVMSTYLIAMAVTDYAFSEEVTTCTTSDGYSANITTRVWAPSGQYNATIIPARLAAAQIAYYCRYFDVPYPLPKEDHILIPSSTGGAMENWGLITYGSRALLWDPAVNDIAQLIPVTVTIAHELGHQWFGNLVTAAWWSSLWLNEGFATFVEYIGSDYTNPELLMMDQFMTIAQRQALAYDSGPNSHAIITDDRPAGAFDSISYAKGGSVIRMMEGVLTRPVFLSGIKAYLLAKSYQNAVSTDLFGYLDAASARAGQNYDVTGFMAQWTQRAGYPLVNCSTTSDGPTIAWVCRQSRFFTYPNPPADDTIWQIPVTGSSSLGAEWFGFWSPLSRTYSLTQPSSASWLKLNANSTGFYRVLYDQPTYAVLSGVLNQPMFGGVHHDDRLGLLSDVYVFAAQSLLSYPAVLNMSLFLQHDVAFTVWQVAHPALQDMYNRLRYTEAGGWMAAYMQQALTTAAGRINVFNSSAATAADELLANVIGASIVRFNAAGKRSELQQVYQQLYDAWPFSSFTDIDPNLIGLVLQVGVADGSMEDWRFIYENVWLQKVMPGEDDPVPALSLADTLAILAAPRDRGVIQGVLNLLNTTSSSALFNGGDTVTLLQYLTNNDYGLPLYNSWIQQPALPDGTPAVLVALNATLSPNNMRVLIITTLGLNDDMDTVNGLVALYTAQLPYDVTAATTAGRNAAMVNVRWRAQHYQPVSEYLASEQWRRRDSSSSTGGYQTATGRQL